MILRPWHLWYIVVFCILATLLLVKVAKGQDTPVPAGTCLLGDMKLANCTGPQFKKSDIPPDLTHIDKHGLSFILDEQVISIKEKDSVVYDLFVYNVTAKVSYEDKREPWIVVLGECSNTDEAKASREAYELGQGWFNKIKKAIITDAHKRGH